MGEAMPGQPATHKDKGISTAARAAGGYSPQSWEARLLAGSLRSVPITLVHGGSVAARDALLLHGLMPLLGRRSADRTQATKAPRVLPFPAAGGKLERSATSAERVLMIDLAACAARQRAPLDALTRARLEFDARVSGTGATGQPPGCVLLVLRGFETALQAAMQAHISGAGPDPFWQTLVHWLQQPVETPTATPPPPQLHVLLVAAEAATPALRWLGQMLPGLGEHALQLSDRPAAQRAQLAAVSDLLGDLPRRPVAAGADEAEPAITAAAWQLALLHAQERAAASAEGGPEPLGQTFAVLTRPSPRDVRPQVSGAEPVEGVAGALAEPNEAVPPTGVPPRADTHAAAPSRTRRLPSPKLVLLLLALAAGSAVTFALSGGRPAAGMQATAAAADRQRPQPPGVAAVANAALPEADDPGAALAAALAPLPLRDLRGGVVQTLAALRPGPRPQLLLLRYDLLQALQAAREPAALAVVAPVFMEPLRVWVRADGPLRHWGDLRRANIDIGSDGGDALTARALGEALFGAGAPSMRLRGGDDADALAALRLGRADALLRLRASALTIQAEAATARGALRELRLDGHDPVALRAAQRYLPLAAPGEAPSSRPAVMSFLAVQGGDVAGRKQVAANAMARLCSALPRLRAGGSADWALVPPGLAPPVGWPYALADAGCDAGPASARALQVADGRRGGNRNPSPSPSPSPEKGRLR
jgi:hypothetical protein